MTLILLSKDACKRTKERFSRFKNQEFRIEVVDNKINQVLKGDHFIQGEPMTYFRISTCKDNLWSCAWEGWIPDCDFIIKEDDFEIIRNN